jgi:hypothetical protein
MQPKGDINGAIAEVERLKANGEPYDYQAIAIAFGCERSTLSRRCRGVNRSHEEYISEQRRHLTNSQEKVLLKRIDYLTDKALPLTPAIVKNMAEEICGHSVNKN